MRLYHGSDVAITRPLIALNEGFADLGRGFYLTDDERLARQRAVMRARQTGGVATVSVFELDERCVPWASWGQDAPVLPAEDADQPFGLRFDETEAGIVAWANYIKACRAGRTEVPRLGSPAIVRAWLATMEIEMVCVDFATAEEIARTLDPAMLGVQYCLTDQDVIDRHLAFVEALT